MKAILFNLIYGVFFLMLINTAGAQTKDTMYVSNNKFVYTGVVMNYDQALEVMKDVPDAYSELKKAQRNNIVSSILGFIAGFSIGVPLGQAVVGGEPQWALAMVGAGVGLISLPIEIKKNKQRRKAVRTFNAYRLKQSK